METGMLLCTEGLSGPVIINILGNPALAIPRYVLVCAPPFILHNI
ncbi:hypothetical protein [Bacillus sp. AFS001701]|nr:hypothetical protein [Bacillus sp. AFS001701]